MNYYDKIDTIFDRDTEGTKQLIIGQFRDQTVEFLKDCDWTWTEKIDGTSTIVFWDGHSISFHGRTKHTIITKPLLEYLEKTFNNKETEELFEQIFGEKEVTFYGEGYGNKIQAAGKDYIPDGVSFILFDVKINDNYQPRATVEECAKAFGIKCVPVVGHGPLEEAVKYVISHPKSIIGSCFMEGIVCRPTIELQNRSGKRVITKIKYEDFKG